MLRNLFLLTFFCFRLLYAQTDAITVTASKIVDLNPEEVTFSIALLADQDATLDQALQALQGLGVAAEDLVGIGSQPSGFRPDQTRLTYQFLLVAPFSKFKDALDKIAATRRSLAASGSNMDLQTSSIQVASSEAAREQARQAALPDLIADARRKGDLLAKAAGVGLGPILGLSDFSGPVGVAIVSGPFFLSPSVLKATFSVSVRFAVQ